MRVLIVNKFLHPNGGSETYIFKLGAYLASRGHEVQYFGMEHAGRIVGNRVEAYVSDMDFHGGVRASTFIYPLKTIYSAEARRKIRRVLEDFQPGVVHLNNFNYQLTPSVILEVVAWRNRARRPCRIVYTAHDAQLVCPNHLLKNPNTNALCEKCLGGRYINCARERCIHGSVARSVVGSVEGYYWRARRTYRHIDAVICPSAFLKGKLDTNRDLNGRTAVMHNFIDKAARRESEIGNYVLYFGRYSEEKGVNTLVETARRLPDIPFVFAGSGPLEDRIEGLENVRNVGFRTGDELDRLIREATVTLCPSDYHDNCPFSILESQERGTPVVGARLGGIPELIDDGVNGRLFERGDSEALADILRDLWAHPEKVEAYRAACRRLNRDGLPQYYEKLMKLYEG